jgi:arylsulfatase A-like enzyme
MHRPLSILPPLKISPRRFDREEAKPPFAPRHSAVFALRKATIAKFAFLVFLSISFRAGQVNAVAQEPETQRKPNIVFFLTDDQAKISLDCYTGLGEVKTPNIDGVAKRGVIFDRHYVTTAICMASRASIMTGLYEYRHGCNFGRGDLQPNHWKISYPMLLRADGYRTAFAGKFGFEIAGQSELPSGDFDKWGGGPGQTHFKTEKNESIRSYADRFPHATRAYGAFGGDFVRESVAAKKPFCLSISFKAPHRPVQPDPAFDDVYRGATFTKPANYGRENGKHLAPQSRTGRQFPRFEQWGYSDRYDEVMAKYNQQIYGVDQAVGMVLKAIDDQGIADNTVVIFSSDNGFLCGSHGCGSKVLPYEESSSVPMIIHDPRHESAGKGIRIKTLTGGIDIGPTILDLAGIEAPRDGDQPIDGKSLLPCLDNPLQPIREKLALMNCWSQDKCHSFAVVTANQKYIFWGSQKDGMTPTEELFDLDSDSLEMTNLAADPENGKILQEARREYGYQLEQLKANAVKHYERFKKDFDPAVGRDE